MKTERSMKAVEVIRNKAHIGKWFLLTVLFVCLVLGLNGLPYSVGGTGRPDDILDSHTFIDDVGNKVELPILPVKLISLSGTHTENIYALEGEESLIGVASNTLYPYRALELKQYDLNKIYGIQGLIEAKPDMVLVEPLMHQRYVGAISQIEASGIVVVSLMPESLEGFDAYITKLAMILNKEEKARELLMTFHQSLKETSNHITSNSAFNSNGNHKKTVFVEVNENGLQTAGNKSLIGQAVQMAGGRLATTPGLWYKDEPYYPVSSKQLMAKATTIDLYFSIKGPGFGGAYIESILQNSRMSGIKAVKERQVYELPSTLIGQYTFRYADGVKMLSRLMYGDPKDGMAQLNPSDCATRGAMALILYECLNLQTITIVEKDYYDHEKFNHVYGAYRDVTDEHQWFDIIETVTMKGYMRPDKDENGHEWFRPNQAITYSDIEHSLNIFGDVSESMMREAQLDSDNGQRITVKELIDIIEKVVVNEGA